MKIEKEKCTTLLSLCIVIEVNLSHDVVQRDELAMETKWDAVRWEGTEIREIVCACIVRTESDRQTRNRQKQGRDGQRGSYTPSRKLHNANGITAHRSRIPDAQVREIRLLCDTQIKKRNMSLSMLSSTEYLQRNRIHHHRQMSSTRHRLHLDTALLMGEGSAVRTTWQEKKKNINLRITILSRHEHKFSRMTSFWQLEPLALACLIVVLDTTNKSPIVD